MIGELIARRVRIRGRVQGVWFRGWTVEQARALSLNGWVRNRRDGSVEILVAGPVDAISDFVERCRVGPKTAQVEHVEIEEAAEEVSAGFVQKASF